VGKIMYMKIINSSINVTVHSVTSNQLTNEQNKHSISAVLSWHALL